MDFNKTTAISDGQEASKSGYKVPFGTVSITYGPLPIGSVTRARPPPNDERLPFAPSRNHLAAAALWRFE